ncbi:MAG: type II toxin-antitoxin system HicA family toxin [Candidatus Accumulibacter sp.]|nr:type II toxin-antitoxin system HicA family toxin [Accumulibacter sp.]
MPSALESLGYEMQANTGSSKKLCHEGKDDPIICHAPHPPPHVDKGRIRDIAEHLGQQGFIERQVMTIKYKGYEGTVEFDSERKILRGKALFISDLVRRAGRPQ